jgi:hypothetical protein
MKKILYLLLTSFILFSCEDLLTEKPKSISSDTFYNTPKEVEAAIGAIYSAYRHYNGMGGLYPAQLNAYTDYDYGRGSYAVLTTFKGLDGNNINRVGQMWDKFYLAIRNANIVIKSVPNGAKLTEADKTKYTAEAKYMRALIYFTLVKNWAGVPIRTEANMDVQDIKRNSAEEVYQLILADLQFAESNLPETPAPIGKPTKWAAKTLIADVYFYQGKNTEARDKAKEVIESSKFALVPVATPADFTKLFGPDVVNTTEEIFYLKFYRSPAQGYGLPIFSHRPGDGRYGGGGYYAHYSDTQKNSFIKAWDKNDMRWLYGWYSYDVGLGPNTILNSKYDDTKAVGADAGNDYPMYRYADVLLMFAEAECRASNGPTTDALEKLNMVHRRAYGKPALIPDATVDFKLADYNKDSFIELVIRERGYETQYEAKRWHDLKRTGTVKERILAATGQVVADKHLLWPIPVSELYYNKAINPSTDQNPGY